MRPNEVNNYQQRFQEAAEKNGLIGDLAMLYTIEKASGNLKSAGAILALIPGVDRFEQLILRVQELHEDSFRDKVSNQCLATLKAIQPEQFDSWQDAKNFDIFLNSQDGSMFAVKQREEFFNFRQRIRIEWTQQVASDGQVREETMLAQLKEEQQVQAAMYGLMQQNHEAQKNSLEKLDQLSGDQNKKFTHLSDTMTAVKKILTEQGIQIDEQTYVLLQSDATLRDQITAVAHYLKDQDEQRKEEALAQREQQHRITNYQGLLDGFSLLSAIGQRARNSTLVKIAGVCTQGVLIHKAFADLSKVASFAVLSPYAAVGMAIVNIISLFMKQGPDSHQVILRELGVLSKQIVNMHKDMRQRFTDLAHQLNQFERVVVRGFKKINYLLTKSVTRSLEEIHTELSQLSHLIHTGFQDLYLKDLSDCVAHVNSFIDGISTKIPAEKPQEWLVQLAHWIKERSRHRQLNGLAIFPENTDFRHLVAYPKKVFSLFEKSSPDFRSVINVFLLIAIKQNQNSTQLAKVPHTGIWLQCLSVYLKLRNIAQEKFQINYDPEAKELDQIYQQTNEHIESLETLISEKSIVESCRHKIVSLYNALVDQFQSIKAANSENVKSEECIQVTSPQHFTFEYVDGKNVYKRKGHQRDFTAENGFSVIEVVQLIGETARNCRIPLFDKTFLLAEKMGLIEFRCTMHRSMSDGRKRKFKTVGKAYGLEIKLYIREKSEEILLTRASSGYAEWSHKERHDTAATIEWHKSALPKKTKFEEANIQAALVKVQQIVEKRLRESREPFYQQVAQELQKEYSIANELLIYLELGKMLNRFNCHQYLDFDYQGAINDLNNLLNSCGENPIALENLINQFFQDLPRKIQEQSNLTLYLSLNNNELQPLQDLYQGKLLLQASLRSRLCLFGNKRIEMGTNLSSKENFIPESEAETIPGDNFDLPALN